MPRLALPALAIAASVVAAIGPAPGPPTSHGAPGSVALSTSPAPIFRPLPFYYDLYSFRAAEGATTVVASFAVPAGRLDREDVDGQARYRFNVSLVLADTARGGVARSDDSVFVAVRRPLADEHLLHTHVETRAWPSSTTVQRVIMINAPNPGTGQLYTHGYVVPDFTGEALMLSDIALGLPVEGVGWRRGGATLALLPSSHFPSGPFDVYYEVYNLPEGNSYTTEFSFEPLNEAGSPEAGDARAVQVRFSGEASPGADGALEELRRVDASLEPGRYWLTVTVTDQETGRRARRSKALQVRVWEEGATMVPACPVAPRIDRPGCRRAASSDRPD